MVIDLQDAIGIILIGVVETCEYVAVAAHNQLIDEFLGLRFIECWLTAITQGRDGCFAGKTRQSRVYKPESRINVCMCV